MPDKLLWRTMPDKLLWPETGEILTEVRRYYRVPFGLAVLAITEAGGLVLAPAADLVVTR